jgi:nitrogen fixation/metabolism regulation signal transduction histidine kinase
VQRLLDEARDVLAERAHLPSAEVMLIGRDGRIHAHTNRRLYGLTLEPAELADVLVQARTSGRSAFRSATGVAGRSGFAPCGRDQHRDFVLGVTVPEAELFADSAAFELVLVLTIGLSLTALCLWSLLASRAITAPVQALVEATRRVAGGDLELAVEPRGGPELGELADSFNLMARELATGREKLAAAQREQAWAEMARQVAHEIKNPLQPMRMSAQLLQRARREEDPRADNIADRLARTVLEQTESLDRIASDFRAFAGSAPGARNIVVLDKWLRDLHQECEGLHAGDELSLTFHPGAQEALVAIDHHAMRRVFVNLLRNTIEATSSLKHMAWHSECREGKVIVRVTDTGPGIPATLRSRLFEPYFTTKSAGTGLGLAICRRLLEAHHGSIHLVHSEPGHTEFLLELPQVNPDTAP